MLFFVSKEKKNRSLVVFHIVLFLGVFSLLHSPKIISIDSFQFFFHDLYPFVVKNHSWLLVLYIPLYAFFISYLLKKRRNILLRYIVIF
jgi:hypothetical protein